MANNKVELADGTVLVDLTSDTVTPETMVRGTTAHDASGESVTGVIDLAYAGNAAPLQNGTASPGVSNNYSREDHVHPTDPSIATKYTKPATGIPYTDLADDTKMVVLHYGSSTWADFEAVYGTNRVVYCRASSNYNPASGSQTRMAFMAYVNNEINPTEVEFQYYRSVSSHTDAQQGDQVFVYKLTKTSGWSVTTRNAFTKIVAGTGLNSSYSNTTLTITNPNVYTSKTAVENGTELSLVTTGEKYLWNNTGGGQDIISSGYCDTAADNPVKIVSLDGYDLRMGTLFQCSFEYGNTYIPQTAGQITLTVNGTTAAPLFINGVKNSSANYSFDPGVYLVYYNGNYHITTTEILPINNLAIFPCFSSASSTTKTILTATPSSVWNTGEPILIYVKFLNANTYTTGTMNFNIKHGQTDTIISLYINGNPTSSFNNTIPVGIYPVIINLGATGAKYADLRTDGKLSFDIAGDAATVNGHTVESDVPANAVFTDATTTIHGLMAAADKVKLDSLTGLVVSDTEPQTGNILAWVDPDGVTGVNVPQINDSAVSAADTYSSQKINNTYLAFGVAQTLTEGQMTQLYTNMGFPSNTAGKLGYTVVT